MIAAVNHELMLSVSHKSYLDNPVPFIIAISPSQVTDKHNSPSHSSMPSVTTSADKGDSIRSKGMAHQKQAVNGSTTNSTTEKRKLVVIGDGAVGKTCLLYAYTQQPFDEAYLPTVFDNHIVELTLPQNPRESGRNLRNLELALWDTQAKRTMTD